MSHFITSQNLLNDKTLLNLITIKIKIMQKIDAIRLTKLEKKRMNALKGGGPDDHSCNCNCPDSLAMTTTRFANSKYGYQYSYGGSVGGSCSCACENAFILMANDRTFTAAFPIF